MASWAAGNRLHDDDGDPRQPLPVQEVVATFHKEPWSLLWAKLDGRFQLEPCQWGGIG